MYYPKELFSINETQTRRNMAAYEAQQDCIYNECLRICPEYNSLSLKQSHGIRKYAEHKLIYIPVYRNGNWEVVKLIPQKHVTFPGLIDTSFTLVQFTMLITYLPRKTALKHG